MTSDSEETDDDSESNSESVNSYLDPANMATNLESAMKTEMDWSYILARTYIQTFEPRGKRCFTKVQCRSSSKV